MMGDGLGTLLGNPMMNLFAMGASRPRTDSHTGPVGIERLLHMVPITQEPFKEMKNLMVIRGENPLPCFDQEHLIEQWAAPSNKGEVDRILQAIAKKPDHLKGVDYKELKNKAPEQQGLLLLKSLLKHTDSESNIQMLAYLKQQGFLKRIEPTPTSNISRTPEASNSPRSNTPTGTDNLSETLGQMSVGPEKLSGADNSTLDSGIQPDVQSNDNDDAA
ncbi:hypothetical protein [Endozoicomonas atrinae]|uniref:hypothetical protein n=1 Tax=Endozoicomonas atrinae TaxID=1333660 RepID=UPI000824358F|nr:hypothetical protein [Endozoicomonas atrinae]